MENTSFEVNIKMGNAAMQEPDDVINALKDIIKKMQSGKNDGFIIDYNGNKVGQFGFFDNK